MISKICKLNNLRNIVKRCIQLQIIKPYMQLQTYTQLQYKQTKLLSLKMVSSFSNKKKSKHIIDNRKSILAQNNFQQQLDISKQHYRKQISLIKQQILNLISQNQNNQYLLSLIQELSVIYTTNKRVKDGLIDYWEILEKLKKKRIYNKTVIYHALLSDYRFSLIKTGKIQQAIAVTKQSYQMMKKNKNQPILIANQLSILSHLYFKQRNLDQSKRLFHQELKINIEISDQTYIQNIQARNNLAILDFYKGDFSSAETVFLKNAQISKRMMIGAKGQKNALYIKHFAYLQGIYTMKKQESQQIDDKKQYEKKILDSKMAIQSILKSNILLPNDLCLYYQTIGEAFIFQLKPKLALIFLQKSLQLSRKKSAQSYNFTKNISTNQYQINNNIAKNHKLLAICYQKLGNMQKCIQNYQISINKYKQNFKSIDAKQLLSLEDVDNFVSICKKLAQIYQNNKQYVKSFTSLQLPSQVWGTITQNIWKMPVKYIFIPFQIKFEIGINLLRQQNPQKILKSIELIQQSIKMYESNRNLLCNQSKQALKKLLLLTEIQNIKIMDYNIKQKLRIIKGKINQLVGNS